VGHEPDSLVGGDGLDWADYSTSALGVSVNLKDQVQALGDAAGDMLVGIENLIGSAQADFLRGDAGANVIIGGAGNDSLQGFEGNDTLEGGLGRDELIGGEGIDLATYRSASSGVVVDMLFTLAATGEAVGDTFLGIENLEGSAFADTLAGNNLENKLWGGTGNDNLIGAGGNDTLYGGAGNDTLAGGAGIDHLTGDSGEDFFVLTNTYADRDRITDFASGVDHLQLSAGLFGGGLAQGALAAEQFVANTTGLAGDADDRFVYNTTNGYLYFDADGSGSGARVHIASLTGNPTLAASDFILAA
jgi:Ca2+-binding RTX toxin-like protein